MNKIAGRFVLFGVPVAIVTVFILLYILLAVMQEKPEPAEITARPSAVFVTAAEPTSVQLSVRTQGEVQPLTEIDLTAQVAGRVSYINPSFVLGGFFEAGDTLVQLEDADYRLAVTRAEALVAQSRQRLIREEAEADLAREEWDSLGGGEASPLALRVPQMAEARASLASAEASLSEARLNLSRTRISAPFSGRIRSKNADVGQFVGPGTPLGRVFSTEVAQIRLPLTDSELGILGMPLAFQADEDNPGMAVELSANVSGAPRSWTGRVVRTDSAINPQTRTLYAIVEVEDPYGAARDAAGAPLAIGLFVEARISGRSLDQAYALPRSALRGSDQVFVAMPDNTLSIRTVTVADSTASRVVVTSGVEAGELVVISPLRAPADGMAITPLDEDGNPLGGDATADEPDAAASDQSAIASAGR